MPNTNAEIGYDDRLQFEVDPVGAPGVFTDLEEVKDFPELPDDFEKVDVTHKTSPGRRREFIAGLKNSAEWSVTCNWTRAPVQEAVRSAKGTTRNWRLIYKTTPPLSITFPSLILDASPTSPTAAERVLMIKLQPSGEYLESDEIDS